jgi:hypothetical protein
LPKAAVRDLLQWVDSVESVLTVISTHEMPIECSSIGSALCPELSQGRRPELEEVFEELFRDA